MQILPNRVRRTAGHLRPRREKAFQNHETRVPLDRNAKARIMALARALKHRTEPRQHYGVLTGKFIDVLRAPLWFIHDGKSGQCNPARGESRLRPLDGVRGAGGRRDPLLGQPPR